MTSRRIAVAFYAVLALTSVASLIVSYFMRGAEVVDAVGVLMASTLAWHWMMTDAEERNDNRLDNATTAMLLIAVFLAPVYILGSRGKRDGAAMLLKIAGWVVVAFAVSHGLRKLVLVALT